MAFTDPGVGRTVRPAGAGIYPNVVIGGTIKAGDPVGYNATPALVRADADVAAGPVQGQFVAMQDGVSGGSISVCTEGEIEWPSTGGATLGGILYASATAGLWTETKPDAVQGDGTTALAVVTLAATSRTIASFRTHPAKLGYTVKP